MQEWQDYMNVFIYPLTVPYLPLTLRRADIPSDGIHFTVADSLFCSVVKRELPTPLEIILAHVLNTLLSNKTL